MLYIIQIHTCHEEWSSNIQLIAIQLVKKIIVGIPYQYDFLNTMSM